jgi:hypothetical protein
VDKSTHITLAGALLGTVVGVPAGMLWQWMRTAWLARASAQRAADTAGKIALQRTVEAALLVFGLAAALAYGLGNHT